MNLLKNTQTIFFALLLIFVSISFAEDEKLSIGGSVDVTSGMIFSDTISMNNRETFELDFSNKFGDKASMEAKIIYSTGLADINPLSAMKDSAVMLSLLTDYMNDELMKLYGTQTYVFDDSGRVIDSIPLDTVLNDSTRSAVDIGTLMTLFNQSGLVNPLLQALLPNMGSDSSLDMQSLFEKLYYSSMYPKDAFILDRILLKFYSEHADFFVGKQLIGWGTGYAWNPTDIFNQKSPTDPTASKSGVSALRTEIALPSDGLLALVAVPGLDFEHSSIGARLKYLVMDWDVSLSGAQLYNYDMDLFGVSKRYFMGLDFVGQVTSLNIGCWGEMSYTNPVELNTLYSDFDDAYLKAVIGLDYTFESGIHLLAETYYNGLGQSNSKDYSITEIINMYAGQMAGMGQNYLFVMADKTFLDYFTFSTFLNMNLNDNSGAVIPQLSWAFTDGFDMSIMANIFFGKESTSEFGGLNNSMSLKFKGFF